MPDLALTAADSIMSMLLTRVRTGSPVLAASDAAPGSIFSSPAKWCACAVCSDIEDDEADLDEDEAEDREDFDDDDLDEDEFLDDEDDEDLDDDEEVDEDQTQ